VVVDEGELEGAGDHRADSLDALRLGEIAEPDRVVRLRQRGGSETPREPRLSRAAGSGEGDQARSSAEELVEAVEIVLAADEVPGVLREIRAARVHRCEKGAG